VLRNRPCKLHNATESYRNRRFHAESVASNTCVEAEIGVGWIKGGADSGALDDLTGVAGEDVVREGMADVLGKANEEAICPPFHPPHGPICAAVQWP
jgi:hypothetical protein